MADFSFLYPKTANEVGKMSNSSWSSRGDELVKCPVDGCHHVGLIITKAHCRLEHGMTRDEVKKKYGFPERVILLKRSQVMGINE